MNARRSVSRPTGLPGRADPGHTLWSMHARRSPFAGTPAHPRRPWIAVANAAHVTLASALAAALALRMATSLARGPGLPMLLGLALGFVAADVASGLLHWLCDTYLTPATTLLGPTIIAPFREHHEDPAALGRHGWLERNGNNCLAALPLLLLAFWSLGRWQPESAWHGIASGCSTAASITLCLTNQIHSWAHSDDAPRLVRWLQRAGVLIAPERHVVHHRGSGDRAYAVVSGWSNRWLDRAVPRAEGVLAFLGVRPCPRGAGS
jgi:plasmanylethanolamine desaturase